MTAQNKGYSIVLALLYMLISSVLIMLILSSHIISIGYNNNNFDEERLHYILMSVAKYYDKEIYNNKIEQELKSKTEDIVINLENHNTEIYLKKEINEAYEIGFTITKIKIGDEFLCEPENVKFMFKPTRIENNNEKIEVLYGHRILE